MPLETTKTALVTGASSGLGLEAAAQLAGAGYQRVITTARTGQFLASKPKKGTGPLHIIEMDYFNNAAAQQALWSVTAKITGGVGYSLSPTQLHQAQKEEQK